MKISPGMANVIAFSAERSFSLVMARKRLEIAVESFSVSRYIKMDDLRSFVSIETIGFQLKTLPFYVFLHKMLFYVPYCCTFAPENN